jgi:hypothetical protein
MSLTKNSAAFGRMMAEQSEREDLSHDEYVSEQYFNNRSKGRFPSDDEQPETNTPKGTKQKDA